MLRVDLPTTRHTAPGAQNTLESRPLRAIGRMRVSRNRRQACPDRAAGPLERPALHYAYATRRSTRASTLLQHSPLLRHRRTPTSAYRLLRNHLVHSASFEAQQTTPAAFASYRCLHICRADTGVISNPQAPRKPPQTAWAPGSQCLRGLLFPPTLFLVVDHRHLPASHRLCLWPRGGLVLAGQEGTSAS